MQILMNWWTDTTAANYDRYRGKNNNGMTKIQLANVLAEKMKKETLSTDRNGSQVVEQIRSIEIKWKAAHKFAESETGAGIKADNPDSFEEAVRRKCKYYFEIKEVMIHRASVTPLAVSANIDWNNVDVESIVESILSDDDEDENGETNSASPPSDVEVPASAAAPAAAAGAAASAAGTPAKKTPSKKTPSKRKCSSSSASESSLMGDSGMVDVMSQAAVDNRKKFGESV
ncbi:MAG: hypothetical protein SGILL_005990, partial [Bacillariaceae sp.]